MQGLVGRPIAIKPAFTRPSRAEFRVVAVVMPISPWGCGAVIFIVWSWNNPVKYTDPGGREHNDFSTSTLSQGDPKKFEKPWYGKIPIISNLLSGTYFFYRNTIKGEGYQDIAYDLITHEMAMSKDQRRLAFGAFMTVASSALFGGLEAGAQKAGEVINKTFADLGSLKGKNMAEAKQLLESNGFRYLSTSKGGYTTFAGPGTGSTRLTVTIRPNGQVIRSAPGGIRFNSAGQ
jgi:hypothetical protein